VAESTGESRLERASALFEALLAEPRERREAALQEAAAGDEAVAAEVRSLLEHHERLGAGFLEPASWMDSSDERASFTRGTLGRYRILERIGLGGMGVVYRAEQENPRREVALKVLRPGLASSEMLERFAREAQVLGRLQHPGVAQIHEAATLETEGGPLPYFAMEYVRGEPLTVFAAGRDLSTRARIGLLVQICEAVQHAHAKGVVHRDLKPANVLVDADGRTRVLDFGVARAIDADVRSTGSTRLGEIVGTLAYMSPEQAAGDPEAIDTRTDVYSLGVVAFELLSGRLPYPLEGKSLLEAARVIQEVDPQRLEVSDRALATDLATIVGKALEKDRERRYASPAALADDLRRALDDLPIAARPPGVLDQLRKFARRNRVLVGASTGLFVLALVAAVVNGRLALRLAEQRDAAEAARLQAERSAREAVVQADLSASISTFLGDVLSGAQPGVGGSDATIADALLLAAEHIDERFAGQPRYAAALHAKAALILEERGRPREAAEEARAAYELLVDDEGADPWALVNSAALLGQSLSSAGRTDEAIEVLQRASDTIAVHDLAPDALTCAVLNTLGPALFARQDWDAATPVMERALEQCLAVHGESHAATLMARNNLANLMRMTGRTEEAEPLLRELMEASLALLGEAHPNTITAIYNEADALRELERPDESEALFQEALELAAEHLPAGHWQQGLFHSRYGELLLSQGRRVEALAELEEGEALLRSALGEDHERTRRAARALAQASEPRAESP
jgi:tetratricopeptide (TPR) repeat protein